MPTVYVNPQTGNDRDPGTQTAPYKTISRALRSLRPGTIVQLAPGTYGSANGDRFPLAVPPSVILIGSEATKGKGIHIRGGGYSPSSTDEAIAIVLADEAQLRGVTVTNPLPQGIGAWIETGTAAILDCTFIDNHREGIRIAGNSKPLIYRSHFDRNGYYNIRLTGNAKGEIRNSLLQDADAGLGIEDKAAPLVAENRFLHNRVGISIADFARPVLRNNALEGNVRDGLRLTGNAIADLGKSQDPGGNAFTKNSGFDVHNAASTALVSAGNNLNPAQVRGLVEFVTTEVTTSSLPQPTLPTLQPPSEFGLTDIAGHWAQPFIEGMVSKNILSGFPDGTFRPGDPLTRAQYAVILTQAFDLPEVRSGLTFGDVELNFWGYDAVMKAVKMGFLSGFPDRTFRPGWNLTRVQAIVALVGGLNLEGGHTDILMDYRDRAQIPTYATNAIATATEQKLVVNYPDINQLEPMRDITRAEVCAIVYQALVDRGEADPISSPYIVAFRQSVLPRFPEFHDAQNHWAAGFITEMSEKGIISGFEDGTFRPEETMNRAQFAALLASAFNPQPQRPPANFADVPLTFWGYDAIQKVYRGGFMSGVSSTQFNPQTTLQRFQVILALASGLGLPPGDVSALDTFADRDRLFEWSKPAIAAATQHHLIVSYPSTNWLDPHEPATRAEVAAMVYQGLVYTGKVDRMDSMYIV